MPSAKVPGPQNCESRRVIAERATHAESQTQPLPRPILLAEQSMSRFISRISRKKLHVMEREEIDRMLRGEGHLQGTQERGEGGLEEGRWRDCRMVNTAEGDGSRCTGSIRTIGVDQRNALEHCGRWERELDIRSENVFDCE
jgi:hypothetical protein